MLVLSLEVLVRLWGSSLVYFELQSGVLKGEPEKLRVASITPIMKGIVKS